MTATENQARDIRIYLIAPEIGDAALAERLAAATAVCDVAALLLPASYGDTTTLAAKAQRTGIATLTAGDTLDGFDGAHIDGDLTQFAIRRRTHPDAIVGFGGVSRRDDGMTAGEAGADYVAVGRLIPNGPALPLDTRIDLLSWWQAVMTVPCVSRAENIFEAEALAEAGADFVALAPSLWTAPEATEGLESLSRRLAEIAASEALEVTS